MNQMDAVCITIINPDSRSCGLFQRWFNFCLFLEGAKQVKSLKAASTQLLERRLRNMRVASVFGIRGCAVFHAGHWLCWPLVNGCFSAHQRPFKPQNSETSDVLLQWNETRRPTGVKSVEIRLVSVESRLVSAPVKTTVQKPTNRKTRVSLYDIEKRHNTGECAKMMQVCTWPRANRMHTTL